jgi:hypothetical protein
MMTTTRTMTKTLAALAIAAAALGTTVSPSQALTHLMRANAANHGPVRLLAIPVHRDYPATGTVTGTYHAVWMAPPQQAAPNPCMILGFCP